MRAIGGLSRKAVPAGAAFFFGVSSPQISTNLMCQFRLTHHLAIGVDTWVLDELVSSFIGMCPLGER